MPPVDRHNPKRAASSESQFSLIEFMRDFPDDAACLEDLWRKRYSDDGTHADRSKCEREDVVFKRYATAQGSSHGRAPSAATTSTQPPARSSTGRPRRSTFGTTPCTS